MKCQICGKESELKEMDVEGEVMRLCTNCSRFGKKLPDRVRIPIEKIAPQETIQVTEKKQGPEEKQELLPEFGSLIKNAREKKGLKQEELAAKLREHASVLQKWERGEWEPNDAQVRKLESVLGISLMGEPVSEGQERVEQDSLTLGDVVEVKE